MPKRAKKIFLALSVLLLLSDMAFVGINYHASSVALQERMTIEGRKLRSAFEIALSLTLTNMQQIATLISRDQQVAQLFLAGKKAVAAEGGGAGGPQAAAIRQALLDLMHPRWDYLTKVYDVRQLQFHLGPGSLSFLRVHKPEKFGDRMDDLRFTIVDTNAERTPRMGFETGRVYSGLRGVVPVWASDPQSGQRIHVGALEAGTSFTTMLSTLDRKLGAGIAVLLRREHIHDSMWDMFIPDAFSAEGPDCICYVEASSRPAIRDLLPTVATQESSRDFINEIVTIGPKAYSLTRIPLRDYKGHREPERGDVGAVVFWTDAGPALAEFHQGVMVNLIYGGIGFLLFETLLFLGLRMGTRRLQREIDLKAEENRNRERFLDSLVEALPDAICFKDPEGRISLANRAYRALLGQGGADPVALIGQTEGAFLPEEDRERRRQFDQEATDGRPLAIMEERFSRPDLQHRIFETTHVRHEGADGTLLGLICISRDVSARHIFEQELTRLVQQLDLILNTAADGIFGLDHNGHVTFTNRAVRELTGWTLEDLVGSHHHYRLHHSRADGTPYPAEECPISNVLRNHQERTVLGEVFWRKDGSAFPVDYVVAPVEEEGSTLGAVVVFRDVSDRVTAESEIARQKAALERSNAELEHFAYVVSHDLQEPLRMVSSFLGLLRRRLGDSLEGDAKEYIAFAIDGAQRMSVMIRNLLDYSRVTTQGDALLPVNLAEPLAAARANLRRQIEDNEATLILPDDLPPVLGDTAQLARLFQNLIGNALKYRDPDRAPVITLSSHVEPSRNCLSVSVADNGIGIDPAHFERIFLLFQRLQPRSDQEGTGIGLAIAKRIVERHGGTIEVTSEPGKGSVFTVTLQMAQ